MNTSDFNQSDYRRLFDLRKHGITTSFSNHLTQEQRVMHSVNNSASTGGVPDLILHIRDSNYSTHARGIIAASTAFLKNHIDQLDFEAMSLNHTHLVMDYHDAKLRVCFIPLDGNEVLSFVPEYANAMHGPKYAEQMSVKPGWLGVQLSDRHGSLPGEPRFIEEYRQYLFPYWIQNGPAIDPWIQVVRKHIKLLRAGFTTNKGASELSNRRLQDLMDNLLHLRDTVHPVFGLFYANFVHVEPWLKTFRPNSKPEPKDVETFTGWLEEILEFVARHP